jgi:NhaA family Na+:H+ antiporter
LDPPVDIARDHILGNPEAAITLVEYGSYACPFCHAAHEVIADLRDRFGDRMRYVFRHLPSADRETAIRAAKVAEYAAQTGGSFWALHDALMRRGPRFTADELEQIAHEFNLPPPDEAHASERRAAASRVAEDTRSARRSGALVTPTFFINGRRYEGAWDEQALTEAMLGSLGHRLHTATLDFVRWGPSTGLLLLIMSVLAVVASNSPLGLAFESWWNTSFELRLGPGAFALSIVDWINEGLLTIFFLVVGLEIKREFSVGRLATRRAATLPVAAALGGMITPAAFYLVVIQSAALTHGWGITITTDTAFAVALIVLLGDRVPVELRVFLTAAVIVDDLVAIAVVALFYSETIHIGSLAAAILLTGFLVALNKSGVYRALPYGLLGVVLWVCLHDAGLHATLAGVILAVVIPTRPPANLSALMAQAQTVIEAETARAGGAVMRHGPSEPALRALDAIHDRIESPADRMLRSLEPWSSYGVLPVFALANAGVTWSPGLLDGHGNLMLAIVLGLVLGKPLGITLGAWLAVRAGIAEKPAAYSWRQLAGAGALGGIGFTMSLFIAGQAFQSETTFAAAKIAIFVASLIAGSAGVAILWPRRGADRSDGTSIGSAASSSARSSPVARAHA